jgi:hypothetical protein
MSSRLRRRIAAQSQRKECEILLLFLFFMS